MDTALAIVQILNAATPGIAELILVIKKKDGTVAVGQLRCPHPGVTDQHHFIVRLEGLHDMRRAYGGTPLNIRIEIIIDAVMKIIILEILEMAGRMGRGEKTIA